MATNVYYSYSSMLLLLSTLRPLLALWGTSTFRLAYRPFLGFARSISLAFVRLSLARPAVPQLLLCILGGDVIGLFFANLM